MARSDDTNDRKREPARPKATAGPRKAARPKAGESKPAAPRKKAVPAAKRSTPPVAKAPAAKPARPSAKKVARPAGAKAPAARTLPPAKATSSRTAEKTAARPRAESRPKPARQAAVKKPAAARSTPPALDAEPRIEDAKYQPRDLPPRLFEEERFIFPESYGQSRIRLLVKDPEWLFAHWDVDPQSLADLRAELGERASPLSKLTLRVSDPQHGGESRVLLPDGARSWYVRADVTERSYRAELGLTLPSGEFRSLAESNTVRTPRSGPAAGAAPRRARYDGAAPEPPAAATRAKPVLSPSAPASDPGPWRPDPSTSSYPGPGATDRPTDASRKGRPGEPSGGASDVYRR
jgi:hypothetical protein